jgi:competence protein ComEA
MSGTAYRIAAAGALALAAALLVTVAVILIVRGNTNAPIQIIAPSAVPDAASAPGDAGAAHPSLNAEPDVRVYIHGAVQAPGVYPAQPGDRLADALQAAGGPAEDADLTAVNLAQRVRDEGYYYIPRAGETPPPAAAVASPGSDSSGSPGLEAGGLINLNTASAEQLKALPNIGDTRAAAIVAYREQNGPFASVEQVMEVSGIGTGIYESIRDLVTVGGP